MSAVQKLPLSHVTALWSEPGAPPDEPLVAQTVGNSSSSSCPNPGSRSCLCFFSLLLLLSSLLLSGAAVGFGVHPSGSSESVRVSLAGLQSSLSAATAAGPLKCHPSSALTPAIAQQQQQPRTTVSLASDDAISMGAQQLTAIDTYRMMRRYR